MDSRDMCPGYNILSHVKTSRIEKHWPVPVKGQKHLKEALANNSSDFLMTMPNVIEDDVYIVIQTHTYYECAELDPQSLKVVSRS